MSAIQVASLIGASMILLAFALQQAGRWRPQDAAYLWFNLVGSGVLTVVAWVESQWGFLLLEAAWCVVSAWGLRRRPQPA